jgi:hypothetical protein
MYPGTRALGVRQCRGHHLEALRQITQNQARGRERNGAFL